MRTVIILFCILAMLVLPVSAENMYVDHNPKYAVLPMDSYGNVEFFVRACGSAQDLTVWVKNNNEKNLTFDPTWRPDGSNILDQNKGFLQIEVNPDCLSSPLQFSSGEYTAYIQHGNGDQMEERKFKVGGGGTERVSFLGAAVTTAKNHCDHIYKILKATYGNGECYIITVIDEKPWIEEVYHPEVNHTVVVIDRPGLPAWDEEVYHPETNHTVRHDEVTERVFVEDGHFYIYDWKWFTNYGWKVKCTNHAEHGEGWHKPTSDCIKAYGHWETVVVSPAWDEIVVDEPAWAETIHHDAIPEISHEEIVVDEKSWTEYIEHPAATHEEEVCNDIMDVADMLQGVINDGYTRFYFDNTVTPGGIFSEGGELLAEIEDPAPQYPKTVSITYEDRCGNSARVKTLTLTGPEKELFDLESGSSSGCSKSS